MGTPPSRSLCHRHSGAPGSQEPRPPHSHSAQSIQGSDKGKGDSTISSKEKMGSKRCSILPKVTQLLSGRAGLRRQVHCPHSCGAPGGSRRMPGWEVWGGVRGWVGRALCRNRAVESEPCALCIQSQKGSSGRGGEGYGELGGGEWRPGRPGEYVCVPHPLLTVSVVSLLRF